MGNNYKLQKKQFEKISKTFEKNTEKIRAAAYEHCQALYYPICGGGKILDVGNGGQSPSEILGEKIAFDIKMFVGLDKSLAMLKRKEGKYFHVNGDGSELPFKDNSFDYVLLNGVIHHLGFKCRKNHFLKVKYFIDELLRVSSKGIIIYEIVTSKLLEFGEKFALNFIKYMPTYVLSRSTLHKYFKQMGLEWKNVTLKKQSDFLDLFSWQQVILEYEWLKIPSFLFPFKHLFFIVTK